MDPIETILGDWQNIEKPATRPSILLSYAQSLDGSIAARRGEPLKLSGEKSLRLTHSLRAASDAILVGIGTILSDDPRLTVRLIPGKNPTPVILDSRLRLPLNARVLNHKPVWIAATDAGDPDRAAQLKARGATILTLPADENGRVDLTTLLMRLTQLGVRNLMVEGGASVITSFLSRCLTDFCVLTIVPVFIGGLSAVEKSLRGNGSPAGKGWGRLVSPSSSWCGEDLIIWGKPAWNA